MGKMIEAPNPKAAFHHFTVAANEAESAESETISQSVRARAQFELARCYLEGFGAERDSKTGLAMLERIGTDDAEAAYLLGEIYANGRFGVAVNGQRGLAWKRESARMGHEQGSEEMDALYRAKGMDVLREEVPEVAVYEGQEASM